MKSRTTCQVCGTALVLHPRGRPKLFCSATCRQRAHRDDELAVKMRARLAARAASPPLCPLCHQVVK